MNFKEALQSEDIRDYAEEVATVAGVGRRCEMHKVFIGEFSEEDQLRTAYKIANWRILKGAITLAPSMSPRDFTDLVKEVVKSAPENLMETLFSTHEVHVRDRSDYRWPEE